MEAAGMHGIRPRGSLSAQTRERRRRRKRSCSPQIVLKWELAVGLAGGFIEALGPTPAPDPLGWCLSPHALAGA